MIDPVLAASAPDIATFTVGAILIIAGALGVVLTRNPVHAALSLVATLFGVAILFIEQDAQFLAAVQVIVYAGAIVILFLFVIMLLGVDRIDKFGRDRIRYVKPLAILFSLASLGLIVWLAQWHWKATGASSQGGSISGPGSNVGKLADSIFTQYLFAFEATAMLLVIAVVGAVILARRPDVDELEFEGESKHQPLADQRSGGDEPGSVVIPEQTEGVTE